MKRITFDLQNDSRPYVEDIQHFENSIFINQYRQCLSLINSYLKRQETPSCILNKTLASSLENNNNIFVFEGERGSGKTSCMLSMANILTNEKHAVVCGENELVADKEFETLSMIDPSFFDMDHNILSLFTARLYKAFLEKDKDPVIRNNNNYRNDLINMFIKVQQNLTNMFEERNFKRGGLEYLVDMAAAIEMREDIESIVNLYLKFIGKENSILLVLIDDIDIDARHAYEMSEQLRKFFIQPNIIVLISLKLEQLSGIIKRELKKEYRIDLDNEFQSIEEEVTERAERYLAKLIPAHQRIYLPQATEYLEAELNILDCEKWNYHHVEGIKVKQVIPELIFRKTRYLFYNSPNQISYIVPRNLRDIRQMLKFLVQLPDYANEDETIRHPYNKKMFREYFYNDWCDINIKIENRKYIQKIIGISNNKKLNYEIIQILEDFAGGALSYRYQKDYIYNITDRDNSPYNISIGDVLSLIRIIAKTKQDEDTQKLLFFIKSFYSMRLYAAYDTISSSNEKIPTKESSNILIQKHTFSEIGNDYESLIGGSLLNSLIEDPIENKVLGTNPANFTIFKNSLMELLNECLMNWEKANQNGLISLAQFLMLGIHYDDSKSLRISQTEGLYRLSVTPVYNSFGNGNTFCFDLGAFFFNLTRIKKCFSRFNIFYTASRFNDMLEKNGSELIKQLQDCTLKHRRKAWKTNMEKWLSYCCFRNIEILEDFLDYTLSKKPSSTPYTDYSEAYNDFFTHASEYVIRSYDRHQNPEKKEEPYTINFEYLRIFANIFNAKNIKVQEWLVDNLNQNNYEPEDTISLK